MSEAFELTNENGFKIRGDVHLPAGQDPVAVVVACHGFKGFKDWGWYPPTGDWFAERGIAYVRFNFSLNGVEDDLLNFTNLENFARNTVTQELQDLHTVVTALRAKTLPGGSRLDRERIILVGHSRGAGNVILHAAEDHAIQGVVSMAGISSFSRNWLQPLLDDWKEKGRITIKNGRTHQDMPLDYALVEDILSHGDDYLIAKRVADLQCPLLVIHGEEDSSVPISEGEELARTANVDLIRIANAQHTFNIKHPFEGFTPEYETVMNAILTFVQ